MKRFIRHILAVSTVFFASNALAHHETNTLDLRPNDPTDECISGTQQIRVNVHGVTHVGIMKLELYASDEGFLHKKGRLRSMRVAAEDGPMVLCIDVPEPGMYAVAGYHDRNGNRKINKKWDMTPKEPVGISNGAEMRGLKVPKFEEASFEVGPTGTEIDFILVDPKAKKKQKAAEDK